MEDQFGSSLISYNDKATQSQVIIAFALPFLVLYEIGIANGVLGGKLNGADAIFRFVWSFFVSIFGPTFSSILFGIGIMAVAGYLINEIVVNKKRVQLKTLGLMLTESAGLAVLIAIFLSVGFSWRFPTFFSFVQNSSVTGQAIASDLTNTWQYIVASVGAGVFEELLFRLLLLNLVFSFFIGQKQGVGLKDDNRAFIKAAGITSIAFSLLHLGTVESIPGLLVIFISSMGLSFIYAYRGLGIAIGTHITFDLLLLFGVIS